MDPLSIARYGMMAAEQRLAASASRVAGMASPDSNVDYATEAVEQIQAKHAFAANVGVIKVADQLVDMGPEGGEEGGTLVAQGTPEQVAATKGSYTGGFLSQIVKPAPARRKRASRAKVAAAA